MKKIVKAVLILMVTLSFVVVLASCSRISEDPLKIVKELDKASYDSQIAVDSSDLEEFADELEIREEDIEWMIVIESEEWDSYDEIGILIYCKNYKTAKEMQQDLENYADENEDLLEEIKRPVIERQGKYVFLGAEKIWLELK